MIGRTMRPEASGDVAAAAPSRASTVQGHEQAARAQRIDIGVKKDPPPAPLAPTPVRTPPVVARLPEPSGSIRGASPLILGLSPSISGRVTLVFGHVTLDLCPRHLGSLAASPWISACPRCPVGCPRCPAAPSPLSGGASALASIRGPWIPASSPSDRRRQPPRSRAAAPIGPPALRSRCGRRPWEPAPSSMQPRRHPWEPAPRRSRGGRAPPPAPPPPRFVGVVHPPGVGLGARNRRARTSRPIRVVSA